MPPQRIGPGVPDLDPRVLAEAPTWAGQAGAPRVEAVAGFGQERIGATPRLQSARPEDSRPQSARPEDSRPQSARPEDSRPQSARPEDSRPQGAGPESTLPSGAGVGAERRLLPVPSEKAGLGAPRGPGKRRHPAEAGRQRLIAIVAVVAVVVLLGGAGIGWALAGGSGSKHIAVKPSAAMAAVPAPPDAGPSSASGAFTYAAGPGQVYGASGVVRHFRVAVENGSGQDPAAFAAVVDQIVGDPRGWTANQGLKLQRVAPATAADFTIFLATPVTSEQLCAAGGLHTAQLTSCYLPGKVILNLARWMAGVSDYGAPLEVYRQFAVNHEIGRFLGASLEGCPGAGHVAPVMMQQTLGLKGCKANPWPYLDGTMYSGPKVP